MHTGDRLAASEISKAAVQYDFILFRLWWGAGMKDAWPGMSLP